MSATTHETPPDTADLPVTVSITRHVAPEHVAQMVAWVRAGSSLAERFPGFLGTGWVRPGTGSDEWHMLYRFADAASLAGWEASEQRRWWLSSAQGLVGESRLERRTGIEGWFDPHLPLVPRVLLTTVVMTPVMTYLVLPRLTKGLEWWLQGRPAPWRR